MRSTSPATSERQEGTSTDKSGRDLEADTLKKLRHLVRAHRLAEERSDARLT